MSDDVSNDNHTTMPTTSKATPTRFLLSGYEPFAIGFILASVIGFVLGAYQSNAPIFVPTIATGMILVCFGLVLLSKKPRVIQMALLLITLILSGSYYQWRHFEPAFDDVSHLAPSGNLTIEGILTEVNPAHHSWTIQTKTAFQQSSLDTNTVQQLKRVSGLVSVKPGTAFFNAVGAPKVGSYLQLKGQLNQPYTTTIPGKFNQKKYLYSQHIASTFNKVQFIHTLDAKPANLYFQSLRWFQGTRQHISNTFSQYLQSPASEVLGGIVLGNHAIPVDKETKNAFIQTGLIHLLAASGLNVGIIAGFVFWIARRLGYTLPLQITIAMLAVAAYACTTGLPPSIQRAATMLEIALILKLINRQLSSVLLLLLASFILLLVNPDYITSLGFQFSVLSTFGIITMVPPLQHFIGRYTTRFVAGLILVPLIAQLWVVPLSVYHFNQFPLHSVAMNILALVFIAPLTAIGFTAGTLSIIHQGVGGFVTLLAKPLLWGLLAVVNLGNLDIIKNYSVLHPASPSSFWITLAYLTLLLGAFTLHLYEKNEGPLHSNVTRVPFYQRPQLLKAATLVGLTLLIALPVLGSVQQQQEMQIAVIPLSYDKAGLVVHEPRTRTPIIMMPSQTSFWEGQAMRDYLKNKNIRYVSSVILWHETSPTKEPDLLGVGGKLIHNFVTSNHWFYIGAPISKPQRASLLLPDGKKMQYLPPGKRLHTDSFWMTNTAQKGRLHSAGWQLKNKQLCIQGEHALPTNSKHTSLTSSASSSSCALFYSQRARNAYRLFIPETQSTQKKMISELAGEQFYTLRQINNTLQIQTH